MSGRILLCLSWYCDICKVKRPDKKISVFSRDISEQFGLPSGSGRENVKYCNDDPQCIEDAKTFSHFKKLREEMK